MFVIIINNESMKKKTWKIVIFLYKKVKQAIFYRFFKFIYSHLYYIIDNILGFFYL